MPPRKVVAPKLSNPFSIFTESDSDSEECSVPVATPVQEPVVAPIQEPVTPVEIPVVEAVAEAVVIPVVEAPASLRVWKAPLENRFESVVLSNRASENKRASPFTHQKGRWMKSRIESEDGWISLRPRPEHEQAAMAAAGIDQSIIPVELTGEQLDDYPRSASEWAERVRQSLEKAEAAPRRSESSERLRDIRDSLGRLSFFRRTIE